MKDALKKKTIFLLKQLLPVWLPFTLLGHPPGPPASAEVIFLGLLVNSHVPKPVSAIVRGSCLLPRLLKVFPVPKLRAGELGLPRLSDVECLGMD